MNQAITKWFKDLPENQKEELKVVYPWMIDSHLLYFCPICGRIENSAECLYETGYYVRTVTYLCKCGNKFQSVK